jgi:hypothetical protein
MHFQHSHVDDKVHLLKDIEYKEKMHEFHFNRQCIERIDVCW